MGSAKATPMMQQYLALKAQYGEALLFYRMGDFYEMFFEDAERAAPILEVALTSRNKNAAEAIPMCGVPVKAADSYIGKLIENGFKVAVCDQIEDPATAKGLVKRDVVRVVTPGMLIENELLNRDTNNFVLALLYENHCFGFAFLDISTGDFRLSQSRDLRVVRDELLRVGPREIVLPESARDNEPLQPLIELFDAQVLTYKEDSEFQFGTARDRLIEHFHTRSLEGFGCQSHETAVAAAGALLAYVKETQKQDMSHFKSLEVYHIDHFLLLDQPTSRNLELTRNLQNGGKNGTLISILDHCVTALGSRRLRRWMEYPLLDRQKISQRHEAVAQARDNPDTRQQLRESLKTVYDLERLASKTVMGRANARDLLALKRSLQALPRIAQLLADFTSPLFSLSTAVSSAEMSELEQLAAVLEDALREDAPPVLTEGGLIKSDYHPELAELISLSRDSKSWLAGLEAREKAATGINSLKVRYNKVFGYYLEIPKSQTAAVPAHYVRKQTLVNAERYITDELKNFETKALSAEEQRLALELSLFNELRRQVSQKSPLLYAAAGFVARLDVLTNLAEVAARNDYVRPEVTDQPDLIIEAGRHPVVEKMLTAERYVPNSLSLNNTDQQVLIITGPNMAGKSTVLRQAALFVILTQMGSFVPAKSASTGIFDRIFTRVGALDNLSSGQSTFMVEMEETANILHNATARSLVVIDEIGRGTSTYDGLSIAWAVAEHLHDLDKQGVKTLFATHYHELTQLAAIKPRMQNFNIAVKENNGEIIFLRKLVAGSTNKSYGIQVARLAGMPDSVIGRAHAILEQIENDGAAEKVDPAPARPAAGNTGAQTQLSFFSDPEKELIQGLKNVSISRLTPLEALNYLNTLQQKALKLSGHQP